MVRPLISCLTVTAGRLRLLKEAIQCYLDQSYPNRELVIVTADSETYRQGIRRLLARLDRSDIRLFTVDDPATSLGRLRNISLEQARGEVVCQWDDDDLYHPDRLRLQHEAMVEAGARACFLTGHLQFFAREGELLWVDWTRGSVLDEAARLVPGSVMAYADDRMRYPEAGPLSLRGEDNVVRTQIFSFGSVAGLPDHDYLYLYRFHGRNTHSQGHHRNIAAFGARARVDLAPYVDHLQEALRHYRLPMPYRLRDRSGETILVVHR